MKLSSDEIKKILPHRYPFLMVDKIIDMEPGKWAKGIKCVSAGEHYFTGHFPERQVMPGVLIMEAFCHSLKTGESWPCSEASKTAVSSSRWFPETCWSSTAS